MNGATNTGVLTVSYAAPGEVLSVVDVCRTRTTTPDGDLLHVDTPAAKLLVLEPDGSHSYEWVPLREDMCSAGVLMLVCQYLSVLINGCRMGVASTIGVGSCML